MLLGRYQSVSGMVGVIEAAAGQFQPQQTGLPANSQGHKACLFVAGWEPSRTVRGFLGHLSVSLLMVVGGESVDRRSLNIQPVR